MSRLPRKDRGRRVISVFAVTASLSEAIQGRGTSRKVALLDCFACARIDDEGVRRLADRSGQTLGMRAAMKPARLRRATG